MVAAMGFIIGKLLWFLVAPSQLLLWLSIGVVATLLMRRERVARGLAYAFLAVLVVFGILPVGSVLARAEENEYPPPSPPPAHVDGVLVLGGGLGDQLLVARHAPPAEASETRLISAMGLARQYPTARIVFSGGWGRFPDTHAAAFMFGQMGLDPARLTLESRSHDTYENLTLSRQLVQPKPGEVWLLATSAIQMPRAMAVAKKLGWAVIPWPTDYLTTPRMRQLHLDDLLYFDGHLRRADVALHEWLGLIVYRLEGRAA
jgi:uncharacterized SAM-binding protein YcdF (DUF218 family)